VSVTFTDDLAGYQVIVRKLELEHQICQFHVRRWVGRTLHDLEKSVPKEWVWVLEEIQALLEQLPLGQLLAVVVVAARQQLQEFTCQSNRIPILLRQTSGYHSSPFNRKSELPKTFFAMSNCSTSRPTMFQLGDPLRLVLFGSRLVIYLRRSLKKFLPPMGLYAIFNPIFPVGLAQAHLIRYHFENNPDFELRGICLSWLAHLDSFSGSYFSLSYVSSFWVLFHS
jgi:hypothetical protein